ncbi:MAG: class I SAM-dependent methyltransferase [Bryobacteraceae bacterium]
MSEHQTIGDYFDGTAAQWRDLYVRQDVYAYMYQQRRDVVLEFVDRLKLPAKTRVLEVGCGPGVTTVELARRGYSVDALDVAPAMIAFTQRLAFESGVNVRCLVGDVLRLPVSDDAFALVIAVGVTEWGADLQRAIDQLARVVARGGHLIVTMDNRWAAYRLLDPTLHPVFDPLKTLMRRSERKPRPRVYSLRQFNAALKKSGLRIISGMTLGFGPFSFFKYPLFSDRLAIRLHRMIQDVADQGTPILRHAGHVYAVLAEKATGD